jgi:hypothetical protein
VYLYWLLAGYFERVGEKPREPEDRTSVQYPAVHCAQDRLPACGRSLDEENSRKSKIRIRYPGRWFNEELVELRRSEQRSGF